MVRYYGRARQRIGAVNTNQLGLKMSGCPSRVGRNPVNARYISHRVNCMNGTCGPIMVHGVPYFPNNLRNKAPYCRVKTTTCQAAAGGVGHINTPYYRTPAPGEKGCGCKFGPCGSPGRPGVSGQFTLKAGAGTSSIDIVGFITSAYPDPSFPSIGIINFEDSSPINKNDILLFIQAENCSLFAPEDEFPPCGIVVSFLLTSATLAWLFKKIAADGVGDPEEEGIPSFILNINGKQYKNIRIREEDDLLLTAFFAPITELDTIEIEDGEFYDFSFS